jgi:hypothetical protein
MESAYFATGCLVVCRTACRLSLPLLLLMGCRIDISVHKLGTPADRTLAPDECCPCREAEPAPDGWRGLAANRDSAWRPSSQPVAHRTAGATRHVQHAAAQLVTERTRFVTNVVRVDERSIHRRDPAVESIPTDVVDVEHAALLQTHFVVGAKRSLKQRLSGIADSLRRSPRVRREAPAPEPRKLPWVQTAP